MANNLKKDSRSELRQGLKIVVVGDGAVGKTSLLVAAATGKFPKEYIPTVFDNSEQDRMVDNETSHVILYDTAGQEEYESLRLLSYPNTDVFLLVFSVDSTSSFDNISKKWLKEIREHEPQAPFIIVGAKADLRDDDGVLAELKSLGKVMLDKEEYEKRGLQSGAARYIECSAAKQDNVGFVIDEAIRVARKAQADKQHREEEQSKKAAQQATGGCCIVS